MDGYVSIRDISFLNLSNLIFLFFFNLTTTTTIMASTLTLLFSTNVDLKAEPLSTTTRKKKVMKRVPVLVSDLGSYPVLVLVCVSGETNKTKVKVMMFMDVM